MEIEFKVVDRFNKSIELSDNSKLVDKETTEGDLFVELIKVIERNNLTIDKITKFSVTGSSSSSTAVKIAYSISNALNYSLGLKKPEELEYPERPAEFYSPSAI